MCIVRVHIRTCIGTYYDIHIFIDLLTIEIQEALCRPGPDLVICDEGHRIRNETTNLSQSLKLIRTKRRVVMTGYPLQNNLIEYWCMVDFVRPSYLGDRKEFQTLFERPIVNGQCIDSSPEASFYLIVRLPVCLCLSVYCLSVFFDCTFTVCLSVCLLSLSISVSFCVSSDITSIL